MVSLCMSGLFVSAKGMNRNPFLVEAKSFADYGGWVDDSQFMDQMGSPFLLAHGLGAPVADAVTQIALDRR